MGYILGIGWLLCALTYVTFYPIGYVDGLFEAGPHVSDGYAWKPWKQISNVPHLPDRLPPSLDDTASIREGSRAGFCFRWTAFQARSSSQSEPRFVPQWTRYGVRPGAWVVAGLPALLFIAGGYVLRGRRRHA